MEIQQLHHVAVPVTDLEKSRQFYRDVLTLPEISRPPFNFPGVWFQAGAGQHVHLIVHPHSTFRTLNQIDTRDIHFALRVKSFRAAVEFLQSKGYHPDLDPTDPKRIVVCPHATAGFPQIYIMDPDHNVIEINAEELD